jgi:hypothetical protein
MSILLLLAITDNFPKFACLFTICTNFLYLYALRKIPTLEVETFEIIATCGKHILYIVNLTLLTLFIFSHYTY